MPTDKRALITDLPDAGTLAGTELVPMWQGYTGKMTINALAAFMAPLVGSGGTYASLAAAATTDLFSTSGPFNITGTGVSITSFGSGTSGALRRAKFASAGNVIKNGAPIIVPGGADYTVAAGDMIEATADGSGVTRIKIFRADGKAVVNGAGVTASKGLLVDSSNPAAPNFAELVPIVRFARITVSGGVPAVQTSVGGGGTWTPTRSAAGRFAISWANSMPDANYSILMSAASATAWSRLTHNVEAGRSASGFTVHFDNGASDVDPAEFWVAIISFTGG